MEPVLPGIGLTHLDTGDLRDRIGAVRRFQFPRQQRVLPHRLFGQSRVDAGRTEKDQLPDPGPVGGVDHIGLDQQVFPNEVRRIAVIGEDAPDLCRGQEHIVRAFRLKKRVDVRLPRQVKRVMGPEDQLPEALGPEPAQDRPADQPAMAGDEDGGVLLHPFRHPILRDVTV